jgi:uncharacterized protein (TIGR04255 family)
LTTRRINWEVTLRRPDHLPEFANPPLEEVVLGVQFSQVVGYQQVYAKDIWELFQSNFPRVEEHEALSPTFETFGGARLQRLDFGLVTGATHDRFWFLTESGDQLIQFQHDKLLHNWRKVGDRENEYPRFETIISSFADELETLNAYFVSKFQTELEINQCEVSYINRFDAGPDFSTSEWFKFLNFENEPDDIAMNFRHVLTNAEGSPYGRLSADLRSALGKKGEPMLRFNLTVRGAPSQMDISAAINFLKQGRDTIVRNFTSMTTESAHTSWERIK